MTMLEQRIQQQFFDSADLKYAAAEVLSKPIADAVSALVGCITSGGKVLTCGNGGSASDAQHFAAEFVGRFERERPGLAAISLATDTSILTAIGNDYDFASIFSKQVQAIGAPGDVLLAISTSGNSQNVLQAVKASKEKGMKVVALTGNEGGKLGPLADVEIRVSHKGYADRIQEIHIKVIHILILLIEKQVGADKDFGAGQDLQS